MALGSRKACFWDEAAVPCGSLQSQPFTAHGGHPPTCLRSAPITFLARVLPRPTVESGPSVFR